MDESVLDKKSFFEMLGLPFVCRLEWGYYIAAIAKIGLNKNDFFMKLFLWRFFVSLYSHV